MRGMKYKNGFFQLLHKGDGTYLKLFPAVADGKSIHIDDVLLYLHKVKLEEFDVTALKKAIDAAVDQVGEFKLADENVLPEGERIHLDIADDRTKVIARFYPPSSKGKLMTRNDIMQSLEQKGIEHGILERNIDIYLKARQFCTDFVIAKATMPIQGKDAVITYHFDVDKISKPKINEDGSVDFHQMDNMNHVEAGMLLATLEPAVMGKPGIDVMGKPIKPKKVKVKKLMHGLNIHLSEDGTKMYSDVAGHVQLTGGKVFVSNTYEVPADVSTATGDIMYDGNVHVKGNVITGFKIEAKGDIIVDGVVEGAELHAGGQIVLRRGIQGMNRGILVAGGDIVTKFIENSRVKAAGSISTDAIMHSEVEAEGEVVSSGKRGLIIGGSVYSEKGISLKVAGGTMGTKTKLEIGMKPEWVEEYQNLDKQIDAMNEEIEKNSKIVGVYAKKVNKGEKLPDDKKKQYIIAKKTLELLKDNTEKAEARKEELKGIMEIHSKGRIRISDVAYPGVKIVITGTNYLVRGEMKRSQFLKDKSLIKITTM